MSSNAGPLTIADLLALWRSLTDRSYSDPFIQQAEGRGLEAHTQAFAQHARVSRAIDRSTQTMYLMPYSGQTSEPARYGAPSEVTLHVSRSKRFELGLLLDRGFTVEELATDAGPEGPVLVLTGRRYQFAERLAFAPGVAGPLTVRALAERQGPGYDNPLPNTITEVVQPGAGLTNDLASVTPGTDTHRLLLDAEPDVISPLQVGQYVQITAGANAGQVRQIKGYEAPSLDPPTGGTIQLWPTTLYRLLTATGQLEEGETILQSISGAEGIVLAHTATHLWVARTTPNQLTPGLLAYGEQSTEAVVIEMVEQSAVMSADSLTASWQVLDWVLDLGFSITNPESPSGGRAPMLEEIGAERSIYPQLGETEEAFRKKIFDTADTVSPNALLRTVNRILAPFGGQGCLREVGYPKFKGMFYDGDPDSTDPALAFPYDLDFAVRPQDRWKVFLSYLEMRAFFLMGVPVIQLGDFGAAFDAGATNAYDASPYLAFYDGYPLTTASIYSQVWRDLYRARAGGVGFDLYLETGGCI
jgi:hypothetical protein